MEAMNDLFNSDGSVKEHKPCTLCNDHGIVMIDPNYWQKEYGGNYQSLSFRCSCPAGEIEDIYEQLEMV